MSASIENNEFKRIGIVGLGLIGGSLARTIKRIYGNDIFILGIDPSKEDLDIAFSEGNIDEGSSDIDTALKGYDLLILCAPIGINLQIIDRIAEARKNGDACDLRLVSDVSSIKQPIHDEAEAAGILDIFIGGHPMAGTEKSGYRYSDAHLLENAYYIITPSKSVDEALIDSFTAFLSSLDVIPIRLTVDEHDHATACVSHLPHIVSAALVNVVKDNDNDAGVLKTIAAGGFRDITRISSSSPAMWSFISDENSAQILPVLDEYINSLKDIRTLIDERANSTVKEFFATAKDFRDTMDVRSGGGIVDSYALRCDLIDEAGEIATIATRLATHHISIKNIGIEHNREFEEGVLKIEFYDKKSLDEARDLLIRFRYTIYEVS